jgi:hypothetical protein
MANNLNEKYPHSAESPSFLLHESAAIFKELCDLSSVLSGTGQEPLINRIRHSFKTCLKTWKSLHRSLQTQPSNFSGPKNTVINSKMRHSSLLQTHLRDKQKSLRLREVKIKEKQRIVGKSLTQIRNLWGDSLKRMRKKVSTQRLQNTIIEKKIEQFDEEMKGEMDSVVNLTFIERQKLQASKERFSLMSSLNEVPAIQITSPVHDSQYTSFAFDEVMNDISQMKEEKKRPSREFSQNMSMEKSFGSWKSEFESEPNSILPVDVNEVKFAIKVLEKANLLEPKNIQLLRQLSALIKDESCDSQLLFQAFSPIRRPASVVGSGDASKVEDKEKNAPEKESEAISVIFPQSMCVSNNENEEFSRLLKKILSKSQAFKDLGIEESLSIPFFVDEMKFANSEIGDHKPVMEDSEDKAKAKLLSQLGNLGSGENKSSPARRQSQLDYQSTGISSQSGLRSRITLKTGGSENSQKVFTPGSKEIEEGFKYM